MSSPWLQVFLGICLLGLLHALFTPPAVVILDAVTEHGPVASVGTLWVAFIGVTQLSYVIPAGIGLLVLKRGFVAAGVGIGAVLTFSLNVALIFADSVP